MINLQIKPTTAIVMLERIKKRTNDVWEHDALVYAINLIRRQHESMGSNDIDRSDNYTVDVIDKINRKQ